ncbi:archease [Candidatus Thorarchaeota archaeon]|nr:MAG: archease [Candidatus Thorarchaeota archaeon]
MEPGFKYREHTADITVECWAPTMEEAFEQAAMGTFEVMLDTSTVEPKEKIEIEAGGAELPDLLVDWITQLLGEVDINYQFYCKFEVLEISRNNDYTLTANAWGEEIDLDKHDTRTEVKAMTYADLSIDGEDEGITITFTLDL